MRNKSGKSIRNSMSLAVYQRFECAAKTLDSA